MKLPRFLSVVYGSSSMYSDYLVSIPRVSLYSIALYFCFDYPPDVPVVDDCWLDAWMVPDDEDDDVPII